MANLRAGGSYCFRRAGSLATENVVRQSWVDVECGASDPPKVPPAKEIKLLRHRHNRSGPHDCRTVLGLTAGPPLMLTVLTFLLTIMTIAQEAPARPAPPTMSEPAVQQESTPSAQPKEPKGHWAELKWTASPTKGVYGYYVYRAVAGPGGKPQRITAVPVKGTRYRDTKVKPGATYIYSLSAVQRINSQWVESKRTPLVTARIPSP